MLEHFWKGFTKAASIATPIFRRMAGTGANAISKATKSNVTRGQVAPLVAKPSVGAVAKPAAAPTIAKAQPVKFRDVTPTTPPFKGQIPAQPTVTPPVNVGTNSINYQQLPETLGKLTGPEQIARRNMLHQGGALSK